MILNLSTDMKQIEYTYEETLSQSYNIYSQWHKYGETASANKKIVTLS